MIHDQIRIAKKFNKYFVTVLLFFAVSFCIPQLLKADNVIETSEKNNQDQDPIRVMMAAAFVSEAGVSVYAEIFHYLGEKLEREIEYISGFSYDTINTMLDSGMVDVGFICGLPYIMKRDKPQPNIELLLAPVMKGNKYKDMPIYYSYIIAHKDSKFNSFSEFKGSRFVYNDEISNSGYNMPRAHLINMGETSGFFGKVIRSGSHEESIRMVAIGEADLSAVDSLVYDYDRAKNPKYIRQTKIVEILGPVGIPPIVISLKTPLSIRQKIRDILIGMKADPVGRAILDKALLDRFTIVDDSNYNGIRKLLKQAEDSGYRVIR